MFKTKVEPRAAGEWFHCQVSDILWRHFYGLYECKPWKHVVDLTGRKNTPFWICHFRSLYSHRPIALDQWAPDEFDTYCTNTNRDSCGLFSYHTTEAWNNMGTSLKCYLSSGQIKQLITLLTLSSVLVFSPLLVLENKVQEIRHHYGTVQLW